MADLPKIAPYIDKLPYDAKTKAALTSAFSDPKPFEAIGGVDGVPKQVKQAIFNIRGKAEMGEKYDLDDILKSITTQPPPAEKAKTASTKTVEIRKSVKAAPAPEESAEEEEAPVEQPTSVEPPTLASESLPSQPLIQPEGSTLEDTPFASLIEPPGSLIDYQGAEALDKVSGLSYKDRSPSSEPAAVSTRTTAPPPKPRVVDGRVAEKKEELKSVKKESNSVDKTDLKKTPAPPATKQGGSYDGKGSNVYPAYDPKGPSVKIEEVEGPGSFTKAFIDLPSNALNAWRAFTGGALNTVTGIVRGAYGVIPRQADMGVEGFLPPDFNPTPIRTSTLSERENLRKEDEKLAKSMPKPVPGAASDLFGALGSAVPFLLTGGPVGAATYGTLGAIEEARRRKDESGIKLTDAQEAGLILSAGIIGASEGLPFARLFRGMKAAGAVAKNVSAKDLISAIFPSLKTRVKSAGVQGFEEGVQELFAELGQNVIETTYGGRKPENLGDNLATAFKTGGEVGVILDFLTKALGTAVGRARFRRAGVNPGKVKEFLEQDPSREFKDAADAVSGFLGTQGEATVTESAAKPAAKAVTPAATPATKAKQESIIDLFEQDPENYYGKILSDIEKAKADVEKLSKYKSVSKSKVKLANDKLDSLIKKRAILDDHITKNVKPSVDAGEVAAEPPITQPEEEAPAAPDTPAAPVVTEEPSAPGAAPPATEVPLTPPAAGQPAAPAEATTPATFSTPNGVTVKDITSVPPKDMMPDVDYEPGVDSIFEAEGVGTFVVFPDKSNPKIFNVLKKDGESSVPIEAANPKEAFEKFIDRPAPAIEVESPVTATGETDAPPGAVTPTSVTQPPPPLEAQPSPAPAPAAPPTTTVAPEPPAPVAPAPKPTTPSPTAPAVPAVTEVPKPKDVKKEDTSEEKVFGESSYPVWDESKGESVNKKVRITFNNSVDRDAYGFSDSIFLKGQIGQEKAKSEAIINAISKATGVTDRKRIREILSDYRSAVNGNVKEAALLDGGSSSATDAPSLTEFAKEVANPKKYQALSTEFYPYGVYNKGTEENPSYAIGSMDKSGVVTSKWSDQKTASKSEADYYISRMARESTPAAPEPRTKVPPVTPIKPEVKPVEPTESAPPASIKIEAPAPTPVNPAPPAPTGAEPTQKSPPPDRRIFINRGSNDRVTVFFKDARDKSFFSAVAKYNGLNSNDKLSAADRAGIVENFKIEVSRIAKDLNISEENARSVLLNYHKAVKDIAQKSPKRSESEIIIEPFTIKEFAATLENKPATSPSVPAAPSTPVAPVPTVPSEAGPTGVAQPDTPGAVAPKGKGTTENTPNTAPPPVDTKQPTTQQVQPSDDQIRNEEEILKFSPIEELSKKKVSLYRDPESKFETERGVKTTYKGESWYSNGHVLVKGNPPSEWKPELTNEKDLKLAKILPGPFTLGVKQVEPIAFEDTEVKDPSKPGKFKHGEKVIMSDGGSISGEYYRYVMKAVNPDSWGIEKNLHYVAFKDGNPVALVMGINADKLNTEKIKSQLKERSSVTGKELWQMSTDELSKRTDINPYSPRYASVINRLGDHADIVIDAILDGKPVPRYVAEGLGINFSMLEYRIAESLADTPEVKNNRPGFERQVKPLVLEYLDTVQQEGPQPGGVVQFVKDRLVKETPPPRTTTTTNPPPPIADQPTVPGKEAAAPAAPSSAQPDTPASVDAQPVATPEATSDNTSSESPKIITKYIEPKTPQYRKNGELMALKLRTDREPVLWVNEKTLRFILPMLGYKNKKNFSIAGMHVSRVDEAMAYASYMSSKSKNGTEYDRIREFERQLKEIKSNSRKGSFTIIVVDSKLRKLEVNPGSYEALKSIPRSKTAKKASSVSDLLDAFRHENIHAETSSVIYQIPRSDANKISADPNFKKFQALLFRKGYTEARTNVYLAINEFTAHFVSGDYDYFVKSGMTTEELASVYTLVRPYILAVDKDSVSRAERFKKPGLSIVNSGPAELSGGAAGKSGSSSNAIPDAMLSTAPIPRRSAKSEVAPVVQMAFPISHPITEENRMEVSTRVPSSVKSTENSIDNILTIGFDAIAMDRKTLDKIVIKMRREKSPKKDSSLNRLLDEKKYPGSIKKQIYSAFESKDPLKSLMSIDGLSKGDKNEIFQSRGIYAGLSGLNLSKDSEEAARQVMERMTDNLLWLYDKFPKEWNERARLWYEGANKIAAGMSDRHKLSIDQASGVLAVLSPGKDWFENAEMAETAMDLYSKRDSLKWSGEMDQFLNREFSKREGSRKRVDVNVVEAINRIRGKSFNKLGSDLDKAIWIRAYDEDVSRARQLRIITPEGEYAGPKLNNNGQPAKYAWQSYDTIAKAISILENGSQENISDKLGTAHKVRNFYNNILSPRSELGHVTVDTHAVGAGLLQVVSQKSTEVEQNFSTPDSTITGTKGSYGLYADAVREASARRSTADSKILPREMQSITWEAARLLFSVKSDATKNAVINAWLKFENDPSQGIDKVREEIYTLSKGFNEPDWLSTKPTGKAKKEK